MTITISQSDYGDLFTEIKPNALQIDHFDLTYAYPSQLGQGYSRLIELRPGLEINIEQYQLHDRVIVQQGDRFHPLEMCFQISGQSCDQDGFIGGGETIFCGSGLAMTQKWEQFYQQSITSVNIHIEPELVMDFWGEDDRDLNVNWDKLFRTKEQPYFVVSSSITPKMQIALQQIFNCPYQGAIARMYLESKVWELMALQLAQITEDQARQSKHFLKCEDRDRLYLAQDILGDRLNNPPCLKDLAKQVGLNECTLKRGFRQVFGTTVFGYLYQQRMEYARQLLQQRELNVGQVAKKVGYASQSRFATAFRKKFGINPQVFARRSPGNLIS
ncbi:MAG: helix-turn-helix transcriptional regulator [Pleurocapsa sp.]